jgi:hypothetical protein
VLENPACMIINDGQIHHGAVLISEHRRSQVRGEVTDLQGSRGTLSRPSSLYRYCRSHASGALSIASRS